MRVAMGRVWIRSLCIATLSITSALIVVACEKKPKVVQQAPPEEQETSIASSPDATPAVLRGNASPTPKATPAPPQRHVAVSTKPPPAELWREVSGRRALDTAGKFVALGPRPAGSAALDAERRLLTSDLESSAWEVESDPFEAASPTGLIPAVNLIARFSADGARPVPRVPYSILIIAAYDTRAFSNIRFVGANDGASGPAILLELARVLSLNPRIAEKIELLLADASEPRQQFSPTDGVAGSRHYLERTDPKSLSRVLVLGGVGANGESLTVSPDTAADVWQEATLGCARVGQPTLLRKLDRYVWGDHVPFAELGISSLYLGNHEYLARYTADDRIENLSATTLEKVGQFATWLVAHWAQH